MKNKVVNAPIKFEKFVMVMIKHKTVSVHFCVIGLSVSSSLLICHFILNSILYHLVTYSTSYLCPVLHRPRTEEYH